MATPNLRAFGVYFDRTRKAFTCNQQDIQFPGGRSAAMGQEGYLCHSKGAQVVHMTLNEITPVGGSDLVELLQTRWLRQENVFIGLRMASKVIVVEFAITNLSFSSHTETGMATGTGTFEGGLPSIL